MTSGPNAGMRPGPTRIASPICVGVARSSAGAERPLVSVAPTPAAEWQAEQYVRYSSRPDLVSPAPTVGIGGPPPGGRAATYRTRASMSAGENAGSRCTSEYRSWASGIRPVLSWKSTDAGPTPAIAGPRWLPSPRCPWQLAQLCWYSTVPRSVPGVVPADAGGPAEGTGPDGTTAGAGAGAARIGSPSTPSPAAAASRRRPGGTGSSVTAAPQSRVNR